MREPSTSEPSANPVPANAAPALRIEGLTVAYDLNPVLWNIDLEVGQGSLMSIVGPNGAGKSTLLKSILGLVPALAGRVEVLGQPLVSKKQRAKIGYVPQRASIDWDFPTTVLDLVTMGTYGRLGWFRRPGTKEKQQALAALKKVELLDLQQRQIGDLSGGQQQRAFIARAFVQDTPIYFMDEPFAGVDIKTEQALASLLQEMRDAGKTIVVVHHDLTTVPKYFDSVTLINREVIGSGPVAEVFTDELIAKTYRDSNEDQPNREANDENVSRGAADNV